MSSESQSEIQSLLQRLITSRNRDLSLFIPFLLGLPNSLPDDSDHDSPSSRIVLINPFTQGMVVIQGTSLETLFRNKEGVAPASKSAVEALPSVEIREGECVICLEEFMPGGNIVKEMPCKHRFHGDCIGKWLRLHGSCPVCRHTMPAEEEEDEGKKEGEIWVSFSFRRGSEETNGSDSGEESESAAEGGESETGN